LSIQAIGPTLPSQVTVSKFGIIVTIPGIIIELNKTAKIKSRPGNFILAKAYAAIMLNTNSPPKVMPVMRMLLIKYFEKLASRQAVTKFSGCHSVGIHVDPNDSPKVIMDFNIIQTKGISDITAPNIRIE
jgi:hypothetical protein